MEDKLKSIIGGLKYTSQKRHDKGVEFSDTSRELAEYNFGYSEGIEYVIELLEELLSESN